MTISIPSSPIEFLEASRLAQAKEHGFACFPIKADGDVPGFVYTIGMAQHQLPELLCYYSNEEMGPKTITLLSNIAQTMIQSKDRFGRIETMRAMVRTGIRATDPDVLYRPTFLTGRSYEYALKCVITRAVRFRQELGMPQVMELRHDDVPSIDGVRAQMMLRS